VKAHVARRLEGDLVETVTIVFVYSVQEGVQIFEHVVSIY
jgi:hypothetical protein